ncbi:FliM/FliN family flagellar motor switch protein [Pseudomonas chlororaphis]|uniref:FliM/FliN family flagellar motor switch protein n=1 Tax=Pseudomonas chlororaphis TaxID=587753 RepID=UPI0015DF78A0|nr:FliM/FliN family flagellar motor switch protein [Pseudomonas chlororaphis]QLL13477.1 FliM/FliN family flagellar motor switch protein [Pseudomonas chlororaphis subsp. aurantiaca]
MTMHQPIKLTLQEAELLRKLGPGRVAAWEGGRLFLGFAKQQRGELVLECTLDEQPLHLGIVESKWLAWIESELPIASWSMLAEDLHLPLAALTVTSLQEALHPLGLPCPSARTFEKTSAQRLHNGWFLRLEHEERILDLQLLVAPLDWLSSLIEAMQPVPEENNEAPMPSAPLSLVTGWSTVERSHLHGMRCGDALVLRHVCPVAQAQLVLFMQRPLATLTASFPDTCHIESVMSDFNDWLDIQPTPPNASAPNADLLVTVVAEVASIDVPLHKLTALKKGDLLEGPIHKNELVALKVGGRPFAYGTLLDIDGQLAVRVERLV